MSATAADVAAAGRAGDESVLFAPSFPQPMYEALRDLSPELLLPGVGTIDLDTVTLLNTTRASSRRTWSASTTSSRPSCSGASSRATRARTYFRQFWDTRGVPAPMPQLDESDEKVWVNRTKEQIKDSPEYDVSKISDAGYHNEVGGYYGTGGPAHRDFDHHV